MLIHTMTTALIAGFAGSRRLAVVLQALSLLALGGLESSAQELVRVYSSVGPAPALLEAASVFSTNGTVKVVSGPPSEWIQQAGANADLVCSSAEFMMSAFIHNRTLRFDPGTVTRLYTRPSAILVRPGVAMATGVRQRIVDLQLRGYAYLAF